MFGLQDLVDRFPFCVGYRVEVVGEEVEVACPSYPERCKGLERGGYMVAQREMWTSTGEQL